MSRKKRTNERINEKMKEQKEEKKNVNNPTIKFIVHLILKSESSHSFRFAHIVKRCSENNTLHVIENHDIQFEHNGN